MDTLDKSSRSEGKEKWMIELFLEDFEKQNWEINYRTKDNIFKLKHNFYLLYAFDLIICHILIGKTKFSKIFKLLHQNMNRTVSCGILERNMGFFKLLVGKNFKGSLYIFG